MRYKSYLRSDHWIETRDKQLIKNDFCEVCGNNKRLIVHHKTYKSKKGNSIIGKEHSNHLQTLCWDCHEELHKIERINKLKNELGSIEYYRRKRLGYINEDTI